MPRPQSPTLPIAYIVLRILIILNWIYGAIVLLLAWAYIRASQQA